MKRTLVIGSTVADVILSIPHLPRTGEDINIKSQTLRLGGCAFNVSEILRLTDIPYTLCSPVGSGLYGDFVARELEKKGIPCFVRLPDIPNGCCYCIVEDGGERTFLSNHGAEYLFSQVWMERIAESEIDSVYICGLEIEEPTGNEIIRYLQAHRAYNIFFAPGARLCLIPREKIEAIFKLNPVLHLNESEALSFTGADSVPMAAQTLSARTKNTVVVTLGENGAYVFDGGRGEHIPGCPAEVCDTIGAGDAHCGAVLAYTKLGVPLAEAVARANRIAAAVVSVSGANLSRKCFEAAAQKFQSR